MIELLELRLTFWRCFTKQSFALPMESQVIIDSNGSGKTSLISAVYSLFSGQPFPETKFKDSVHGQYDYFGISTQDKGWFIAGKTGVTGRLSTKVSVPTKFDLKTVKAMTYLPTDNLWFFQSSRKKVSILDEMLIQIHGKGYKKELSLLSKLVSSKTRLIKSILNGEARNDAAIAHTLSQQIYVQSQKIWKVRQVFLLKLQQEIKEFSSWIHSPLKDWQIDWKISASDGYKQRINLNIIKLIDIKRIDWSDLWKKELIIGKVMFGAQRDDFSISSDYMEVQNVLSRGEMRSLILFIKNIARALLKDYKVIWFLDDVFNELDEERESLLFEKILRHTDIYIATGTKKPSLKKGARKVKIVSLDNLKA